MCLKSDRLNRLSIQIFKDIQHVNFLVGVRNSLDFAYGNDKEYDPDKNRELVQGKIARLRKRVKENEAKANKLQD